MQVRGSKPRSWRKIKINPVSRGEVSQTWWGVGQDALAHWHYEKLALKHDERKGKHSQTKRSSEGKVKTKLSPYSQIARLKHSWVRKRLIKWRGEWIRGGRDRIGEWIRIRKMRLVVWLLRFIWNNYFY